MNNKINLMKEVLNKWFGVRVKYGKNHNFSLPKRPKKEKRKWVDLYDYCGSDYGAFWSKKYVDLIKRGGHISKMSPSTIDHLSVFVYVYRTHSTRVIFPMHGFSWKPLGTHLPLFSSIFFLLLLCLGSRKLNLTILLDSVFQS